MTHNRLKKCTSQVPFKNNQNSYTCSNSKLSFRFKALSYEFETNLVWAIENLLTPCAQYVLMYVTKRRRNKHDVWASQTYLGAHVLPNGIYTRETINRAVAELESYGLMATIYRHEQTCLYEVWDKLKQTHIIKLLGRSLERWYQGFKSMFTEKVTLVVKLDYLNKILFNLLLSIGKNSHKCGKWVEGIWWPQRFVFEKYIKPPPPPSALSKRDSKKGRYQAPNSLQRRPIRQDKCERIIVLVEEKHVETYEASDSRKKVSYLDGFFEICKANALKQQTPQLRATPLKE